MNQSRLLIRWLTPATLAGVLLLVLAGCSENGGSVPATSSTPSPIPTAATVVADMATAAPTQASTDAPSSTAETPPVTPSAAAATPSAGPATQSALSSLPDPSSAEWVPLEGDLERPIGIANAGDGSNRLFILEQAGRIRVFTDGVLQAAPYLDITDRVGSNGSERGLLGLAFHPGFSGNRFFYVNYTDLNGDTVIARFTAASDPSSVDPDTELRLLQVDQPYPNHNGGGMAFGPDGYLYLGLGDGGSAGDPRGNGQSLDTLLGKLLRIDVDSGQAYGVPEDNPLVSGGGKGEIWDYGLRNPWRFSFDRQTGDLYIGDVGQNEWEEIDFEPAGSPGGVNFGWNFREGMHDYSRFSTGGGDLVDPIFEYNHSEGCSVTGGYVYRGQNLPGWQGVYVFGDYCSGNIWGLANINGSWQGGLLYRSGLMITSFGEDEGGELYAADHNGKIYRLDAAG